MYSISSPSARRWRSGSSSVRNNVGSVAAGGRNLTRQNGVRHGDRPGMNFKTTLDVDLVAVETDEKVAVLLELNAPAGDAPARAPRTLQVVLDRSGSMSGDRLAAARQALEALVARLDPADAFGLVAFDDEVQVPVPAAPLADKAAVVAAIRALGPGGMTNLSGGYLRAMQEARRASGSGGATLLMLSDGHANAGILDDDRLQALAAGGRREGLTTATIGLGL